MAVYRAFIAIDVPPSLRAKLQALIDQLRRRAGPGEVRWVRPEGIHLTLKFLGDIPVESVDGYRAMLDEVGKRHAPFSVVAGGLGGFPSTRQPNVIWVGTKETTGALDRLQREVEVGAIRLGVDPEDRAFSPHLTLGRTQRGLGPAKPRQLGGLVARSDPGELGEIHADSVSLISSELKAGQRVYTRLTVSTLGG